MPTITSPICWQWQWEKKELHNTLHFRENYTIHRTCSKSKGQWL